MEKSLYVQEGKVIAYINPSSTDRIKYGDVVVLADTVGVAVMDIPPNSSGSVQISEAFQMPAETTTAFTQGMIVYWDNTNKVVTATSTDNVRAGIAMRKKETSEKTALVKLG